MSVGEVNGRGHSNGRPYGTAGAGLIRVSLPPGTPPETETAVRRLVELTGILAQRCAQLQQALQSRVVIEQAKGILSERYGITCDEAFERLRRTARSNRIKLRSLTEAIVAAGELPPPLEAQLAGGATTAASARRRDRTPARPRS